MTDLTSDAPITARQRYKQQKNEYYAYFALIFLASLPICLAIWIASLFRLTKHTDQGPVRLAWTQARTVAPKIFWA